MKSIQELKEQVTRILNSQLEVARVRKSETSNDVVIYFDSTFTVVDRIQGELKITNNVSMPTLFSRSEACDIVSRLRNGHNEAPTFVPVNCFYKSLEPWLMEQLENVKNL